MHANISVHEPSRPMIRIRRFGVLDGRLSRPSSAVTDPPFWAPGWNSVQAVNKFQDEVGRPASGRRPGRAPDRTRAGEKNVAYFENAPGWLRAAFGRMAAVADCHHIFGSEELSALAPGIAELSTEPYLALNPDDAVDLWLGCGG